MNRTLIWCGACGALLTAAVAAYLGLSVGALEYVPAYVETACQVATSCNPVCQLGAAAGKLAYQNMMKTIEMVTGTQQPSPCCPAEAPDQKCTRPEQIPSVERQFEVIDLGRLQEMTGQNCDTECKDAPTPLTESGDPSPSDAGTPVYVPPGTIEENEEAPPMGPSYDDSETAPEHMPAAQEGDPNPGDKLFDFWVNLVEDAIKESMEKAKEASQDKTDQAGQAEEQAEPKKAGDKEEDGEESEPADADTLNEGKAPDCHEDPNYHKQYPSCPYMGDCPHSSSAKAEPVKDDAEESSTTPESETPAKDTQLWRTQKPSATEDSKKASEETHPDIDTMEFREKDDAREGEFDNQPM